MIDYTKLSNEELSAKVAEEVMGWKRIEHTEPPEDYPVPSRYHSGLQWQFDGKRMACEECGDLPKFPTSIADAMEIWKKLKADGFNMFSLNEGATGWWCVLYPGPKMEFARGGLYFESDYTDEPGRAVCCAALDYAALRAKESAPISVPEKRGQAGTAEPQVPAQVVGNNGDPGGTRTHDPVLRRQTSSEQAEDEKT